MNKALRVLALVAFWLFFHPEAGRSEVGSGERDAGDERILSFRSEITVAPDASLLVRETIRVRVAQREINHGIYRDLPKRFRRPDGVWFTVPITVTRVLRDGKPEPWQTKERENDIRAYIGDAEKLLEPGVHTYSLEYRTDRHIGYFNDHDELAWNVTGYNWTFPVDEVEARVLLPRGVPVASLDASTGARGSREREATASWEGERGAVFRSTRSFPPREGLRVIVRWPKGYVLEPVAPRHWWRRFLGSNRSAIAGLAGLLVVLTYYILAGRHAARARVHVEPRGKVPGQLSPAEIRVARTGDCDARAFAATVVQMAVKGFLVIEERDLRYTLRRGVAARRVLAPAEALLADDLDLERAEQVRIESANQLRIASAVNDLKNFIRISLERLSLIRNYEYLLPGLALSVVVLGSTLSFEPGLRSLVRALIALLLFFWTILASLVAVQLVARWQDVRLRRGPRRDTLFHAASITVFAVPIFCAEIVGLGLMTWLGSYSYGAIFLSVALLNACFHYRFKAPDAAGRGLLDEIEGFAGWLATSQADGPGSLATESTVAVYEQFLPHAIALEREEQWSRQCAALLAGAGGDGRGYQPGWCRSESTGGGWDPARFAACVGEHLCAAIVSAVPELTARPAGSSRKR